MKDTNNLLDYNVWSCCDYTETTAGFNGSPIITNNYSTNGEHCIRLKNDTSATTNTYASIPCSANTRYTLICKIHNPSSATVLLRDNTWASSVLYVPSSEDWLDIELSYTTAGTASSIYMQFNIPPGSDFYVDEICLIKG